MDVTVHEAARQQVPPAPVLENWLAALAGVPSASPRLLAALRGRPHRTYGVGRLPGSPIAPTRRASAAALTATLGDVRLASGCGPSGAWRLEGDLQPSVVVLAPQLGRLRVRRGDQVVLIAPGEACLVADDVPVLFEGVDDIGALLLAIVPAHRMRTIHQQLHAHGIQRLAPSAQLRAGIAYAGSLLISTVTDPRSVVDDSGDIVASIVAGLAEHALASGRGGAGPGDVRQAALRCIERHHRTAAFGVDDLARELYISRRQLYRAFPDAGGIAGMIASRRLQTAERLMIERPSLQLSEVAALAGFSTAGVMRAHFRRSYGTTPQRHRDEAIRLRQAASAAPAASAHPKHGSERQGA